MWQEVTNSISGGSVTGGLVIPGGTATPKYDADGNLTFDGVWNYQWDAENRLVSMNMTNNTTIAGLPATNRYRLDFQYDYMNRRISKVVSTNTTGNTFVSISTNYYVYDGWNVIGVFVPSKAVQQACVWGLDLSMTTANAGGIGGLLMVTNSGTNYFTTYDGNGNITGLVNASTKATTARYEYSPFGEPIRISGPAANANPFRFSTKFCDAESGLVYYGSRYYNPALGRWLGRDPYIGRAALRNRFANRSSRTSAATDPEFQEGGLNLNCFVANSPLCGVDPDGEFFDLTSTTMMLMDAMLADSGLAAMAYDAGTAAVSYLGTLSYNAIAIGMIYSTEAAAVGAAGTADYLALHPEAFEEFCSGIQPTGLPAGSIYGFAGGVASNIGSIPGLAAAGASNIGDLVHTMNSAFNNMMNDICGP